MTAAKALGAGVFGIFAPGVIMVVDRLVGAVMGGADADFQGAVARILVGAISLAITYFIPNKETV